MRFKDIKLHVREHPYYGKRPEVGRHQWIFSCKHGRISMIELRSSFQHGRTLWQIYCLEGNLFEGTINCVTRRQAENEVFKIFQKREACLVVG